MCECNWQHFFSHVCATFLATSDASSEGFEPSDEARFVLIGKAMRNLQFWLSSLVLCVLMHRVVPESRVKNVTSAVTKQIRSLGFPGGSGMGIFFAISIPVDIPNKAISFSLYFEANYALPPYKNFSDFEAYYGEQNFDRKLAYEIVERKLERAGYPGRVCLMRAICDAARNPVTHNGLIGDLLHIILTPSSSKHENVADEIQRAEHEKDCENKFNECPVNVLDLISGYI